MRCVTVFCASSNKVPPVYHAAAAELGRAIGEEGWTLVYGGGSFGLMGVVARHAKSAGGRVVGVIPQKLIELEAANNDGCDELLVVEDMRQRKALLDERCDAFVTLPGGIGTLEELFEMLVGRYLGFHDKPIVLVNVNRFFDPLVELIRHGVEQHFINPRTYELMHVCETVAEAVAFLRCEPNRGAGL